MNRPDTLTPLQVMREPVPQGEQRSAVAALEDLCARLWNGEDLDRAELVRRLADITDMVRPELS